MYRNRICSICTEEAPTSELRMSSPLYMACPLAGVASLGRALGSVTIDPPLTSTTKLSRSPRYAPAASPDHVGGNVHRSSCRVIVCTMPLYNGASQARP